MIETLKFMQKIDIGDHLVMLYRNGDTERIIAAYVAASLMRNERCMYIKGDTDTEIMLLNLSELVDYKQAIKDGQLFILDKSEAYSKHGAFVPDRMIELLQNEANKAIDNGYSGLSVTGEISWVLDYEDGRERIIEYEWKLNDRVFGYYPVTALCRYNLDNFSPSMIKSIIELHPYIFYENQINENPYYVAPEGFRDNKIEEYEVKAWLKNINNFTDTKSKFISDIKKKDREYEDLFNHIQDGIFVSEIDSSKRDLLFRNVNTAGENLSGYNLKELEGSSVSNLDATEGLYEWANELNENSERAFESELTKKDGTSKPVEITATVYKENGRRYILSIARDISLRKRYVEDILTTVTNFLEIHDNYTKGHSEKVAVLAKKTAIAMGLPSKKVTETYLTGLVHDIGKILISSDILNKPGKLSDDEFKTIRNHPSWAYEAIIKNEELTDIAKNARHHHERWDGCGYPDGLKEKEIPIVSQILIVVDAYDAMTSERAYRKAMGKEDAIKELLACKGSQFPPNILDIFIEKVIK